MFSAFLFGETLVTEASLLDSGTLREALGEASVHRFHANVWAYLDRDKNGSFDFDEFCLAFAPVIDDHGDYMPGLGLYGAQIHALSIECTEAARDKIEAERALRDSQRQLEHQVCGHDTINSLVHTLLLTRATLLVELVTTACLISLVANA